MLTHLLFNAIRYAPKSGTITLEVEVNQTSSDTATIVFKVCDRGIGIPVEDQDKIFDAYYRASNADSIPGTPGVGLGLAVVKRAVVLHGGSITLSSQVGAGTTVMITLEIPFS